MASEPCMDKRHAPPWETRSWLLMLVLWIVGFTAQGLAYGWTRVIPVVLMTVAVFYPVGWAVGHYVGRGERMPDPLARAVSYPPEQPRATVTLVGEVVHDTHPGVADPGYHAWRRAQQRR